MAIAQIKFTQGVNTDLAGRALVGLAGAQVDVTNGNNTGVTSYRISLLDKPLGSALTEGVIVDTTGATPFASFTPDVAGTYSIQLRLNGDDDMVDVRDFIVPNAAGWYIPALNSNTSSFNYGGQTKGWKTALSEILDELASGLAVFAFSDSVATIVALRAVISGQRENRQTRFVGDAKNLYVYSSTLGAGVVDDGYMVVKPNDVVVGDPGRWYRLPNTETFDVQDKVPSVGYTIGPNAPVPAVPVGISAYRGDVAGVPRVRAGMMWDESISKWCAAILKADKTIDYYADIAASTASVAAIEWSATSTRDLSGAGNPNGVVTGNRGDLYRSSTGALYFKYLGSGDNINWAVVTNTLEEFLGGDLEGLFGDASVKALRGDTINQLVTVSANALLLGDYGLGGTYATNGNFRFMNDGIVSLGVRNDFQAAGTGNFFLVHYDPDGQVLNYGYGDNGPPTETTIRGQTLYMFGGTNAQMRVYEAAPKVVLEAWASNTGRTVLSLVQDANFSASDAPTGDRIVYVGRANTAPSSNPVNGAVYWADSTGFLWIRYADGNVHRSDNGGYVDLNLTGNYTLVESDYRNGSIDVMTSTGNYVLTFPDFRGRIWRMKNSTNRTITMKTAAQVTGVTMGNLETITIICDNVGNIQIQKGN